MSAAEAHPAANETIAVLGGGYAGLLAARRAARAIAKGRRADAAVVLIDADDAWQERTRWHQIAAGETVRSRSRARIFRGSQVGTVAATVTGGIDHVLVLPHPLLELARRDQQDAVDSVRRAGE
jgi:NADH dehydrogenase FAD-containing subunit